MYFKVSEDQTKVHLLGEGMSGEILWQKIHMQLIDYYGVGEDTISLINLQKQLSSLANAIFVMGQRFKMPILEITKSKIKAVEEQRKTNPMTGKDYGKQVAILSKWLGYHLNTKETSIKQYFDLRGVYQDEVKAQRAIEH